MSVKKEALTILFLCFWAGSCNLPGGIKVKLEPDRISLRMPLSLNASLNCCYQTTNSVSNVTWIVTPPNKKLKDAKNVDLNFNTTVIENVTCHSLMLLNVSMNDTGFYQCVLKNSSLGRAVYTHGTYLQVYRKMVKTLNISESAKNSILTAEGVFLMLVVLFPGCMLLCKSNKFSEQKSRKVKEENIYEVGLYEGGLNLEECCSAYDQVQRSLVQGPYQDVGNMMIPEEEEEIQLEKP